MKRIVLIWIWWIWVSAVARMLLELWFSHIIWIDSATSEITESLKELGIKIVPHGSITMSSDDFVVYSAAAKDCEELKVYDTFFDQYPKKGCVALSYFQFLGEVSKYFSTIAIAWTHGKSTTTGLTAQTLSLHSQDFWCAIVWAWIADWWWKNMIINPQHKKDIFDIFHHIVSAKWPGVEHLHKKYLFVVEACEYNKQFLSLDVDYAWITNIELDHVDIYGNIETYMETFLTFTKKVRKKIFFLEWLYWVEHILLQDNCWSKILKKEMFTFSHLLWAHNHLNASLALGICTHICETPQTWLSTDITTIKKSLSDFLWLRRRWETLGKNKHWISIITDYGHHPTELASTLEALQEITERDKIACIFQPHQARRIAEFWDEFVWVFQTVSDPTIFELYTAREQIQDLSSYTINSTSLRNNVASLSDFDQLGTLFAKESKWVYTTDLEDIIEKIQNTTEWVIVIFTAGNLDWKVRKRISQK